MAENKIGRNELCLCGSGKKYKNCCEGKAQWLNPVGWATVVAIVVAVVVLVYFVLMSPSSGSAGRSCPPGTVWTHGHCHKA